MVLVTGLIYRPRALLLCIIHVHASSSSQYGTFDMGLFRTHMKGITATLQAIWWKGSPVWRWLIVQLWSPDPDLYHHVSYYMQGHLTLYVGLNIDLCRSHLRYGWGGSGHITHHGETMKTHIEMVFVSGLIYRLRIFLLRIIRVQASSSSRYGVRWVSLEPIWEVC